MKIQINFATVAKSSFAEFQNFQVDNSVDFENCCKTRIFLQKSVPIQPKTSNILPKFCRSAVVPPTGARRHEDLRRQQADLQAAIHALDQRQARPPAIRLGLGG